MRFSFFVPALIGVSLLGCASKSVQRLPDLLTPGSAALQRQVETADARVRETISLVRNVNELARADGYVYTVDVAQLLTHAALRRDSALYQMLRSYAVAELIQNSASDPYVRGFVAWRRKQGSPLDASTTEGLRIAEGLWTGAEVFGDTAGRSLAVLIVRGYLRHAYEDQGTWLIRNNFNFQTRSFATNSFLVDYDPDFLATVAEVTKDTAIATGARNSYQLVERAITKAGLIHEMIQPEILTVLPLLESPIFSPNDVVSTLNSCTVAERVVRGRTDIARRVLRYFVKHDRENAAYYYGRSGDAVRENDMSVAPLACLTRLAIKLGDRSARDLFLPHLVDEVFRRLKVFGKMDLFASTEVLTAFNLALHPEALPR